MKRHLYGFLFFLLIVSGGLFLSPPQLIDSNPEQETLPKLIKEDLSQQTPQVIDDFNPEFTDLPNLDSIDHPEFKQNLIELNETDGAISDIDYDLKKGERWQVLTKNVNSYTIQHSTTRPSKSKNGMFEPRFDVKGKPLFAFKNIKNLKPGKANIVYQRFPVRGSNDDKTEHHWLKQNDIREYILNGTTWRLRVSRGLTKDGTRVGVLLLSDGKFEQVVDYYHLWDFAENNMGDVILAGDLDNDGKLDLYLASTSSEESQSTLLYLSSHAKGKNHVKLVASYWYGGC